MVAILPRDVGSYSYAGTGYANPDAVSAGFLERRVETREPKSPFNEDFRGPFWA
jgi:hypothetical protein